MRRAREVVAKILEYYPRCIKLAWEASPWYASSVLLFSVLASLAPAAQVWISKVIIDRIIKSIDEPAGLSSIDWITVLSPIGIVLVVWMIGGICNSVSSGFASQLGMLVRNYSQHLVLRKAAELDVAFFETPTFFDQMEKARGEGYRAQNLAVLSINIVSSLVSLVAMLALLLDVHWATVLVLLLTSAPQVVAAGHYAGKRFTLMGDMTRSLRLAHYLSRLLGSREAVKEIKAFGLHEELLRRFNEFWDRHTKEVGRLRFSQEKTGFLLGVLSMLGTASIWAYAVVRAVAGGISVGSVALAFQASERGRSGLNSLFQNFGLFYEHTIFAGVFFGFLDLEARSVEGALAPPTGAPVPFPKILRAGIEFRNVWFRYPRSERFALKDISFTIQPGESVAIVGENGAGKTTLVKLLTRLYDPTEGAIFLEGCDLREYDAEELRRHFGVIFQDFVRYDLSVRENIGFGQVEYLNDQDRIAEASEKGGSIETVRKLPHGFDTMLGKTLDEGVDLSGGEWQKIALSRAFIRSAEILILDEPTAALDSLAEREVYSRFAELTVDRTTIFVSHRFSTVRMAKHILVLRDGKLIEQGSHDELIALSGRYAEMFNAQAERYK